MFSPDGGLLYLFGEEIIALDTDSFEEVDRWELSRIEAPALERFSFGFRVDANEEPGYFTSLFRVQDPVQNRRLMGVARINLAERDVDFYTLGPDQPLSSFTLAPDRRKAYAILSRIGHYEFWTFDLEERRNREAPGHRGTPAHGAAREHQRPAPLRPSSGRNHRPLRGVPPTAISAPSASTAT